MYQPEAYGIALLFMIISMLCWGSWANTMKLTAGYAFQLFYWDYVIGIVLGSLVWGFTLGNWGGGDLSFLSNISQADSRHMLFAIAGGAVFNVANLLLVAAIDIAGLAVAFPIGIGLALGSGRSFELRNLSQGPSRTALRWHGARGSGDYFRRSRLSP